MREDGCAVIKIGGSILTSQLEGEPCFERGRCRIISEEINALHTLPILVHGGGTFAKPQAIEHGYVDSGYVSAEQNQIVANVNGELSRLSYLVHLVLFELNLAALPVNVMSLFSCQAGKMVLAKPDIISTLLSRNILPIIGGGFVADDRGGFSVCSSDVVAAELALYFQANALVFLTKAKGVFRDIHYPETLLPILTQADCAQLKFNLPTADVSGGMQAKITSGFTAVARNIPTYIIDGRIAGNLLATIQGAPISGTLLQ